MLLAQQNSAGDPGDDELAQAFEIANPHCSPYPLGPSSLSTAYGQPQRGNRRPQEDKKYTQWERNLETKQSTKEELRNSINSSKQHSNGSNKHGLARVALDWLRAIDEAQLLKETLEFNRIKRLGKPFGGLFLRSYPRDVD